MIGAIGTPPIPFQSTRDLQSGRTQHADSTGSPLRAAVDDAVSVAASPGQDRSALLAARSGLDLAIAAGRQTLSVLAEVNELSARAALPGTPDEARMAQDQTLRALTGRVREIVDHAIAGGARALAGEPTPLSAQASAGGLDLRMDSAGSQLGVRSDHSIATAEGARATYASAREGFMRVSAGLARLEEAAVGFDAHLGAVSALDKSLAARLQPTMDEEGARVLALQVRQSLAGIDMPIVQAGGGVLAHFRA